MIKAQIEHLEAAAGIRQAKTARRKKERSEGEAAEYIAQLTARIYEHGGTGARAGDGRAAAAISRCRQPPSAAATDPQGNPREALVDGAPEAIDGQAQARLPASGDAQTVRARTRKRRALSMRRLVMLACLSLAAPLAAQTPAPTTQNESAFHAELRREGERLKENVQRAEPETTRRLRRRPGHGSSASRRFGTLAPQNGVGFGPALVMHHTPNENWRLNWSADFAGAFSGGGGPAHI